MDKNKDKMTNRIYSFLIALVVTLSASAEGEHRIKVPVYSGIRQQRQPCFPMAVMPV